MKKRWFLYETAALFAADQICKAYVEQNMDMGEERKLADHVIIRRVHNKGMSLGILSDMPKAVRILSASAAGIVTVLQMFAVFRRKQFLRSMSLTMLSSGAWSNTFDRFIRGYVVDYIGFEGKEKKTTSLTYNLGDFFIFAGTAGTALCTFFRKRDHHKRTEN